MNEPLQISDKAREAATSEYTLVLNGGLHKTGRKQSGHFVQQLLDEETKPLWEMLGRMANTIEIECITSSSFNVLLDYRQLLKSKGQSAKCDYCGKPATCRGRYEDAKKFTNACDDCCGHGNEDGKCQPL